MKTKFFAKTIALGVLVWLFFAPTQVKAQVLNPYTFMNNTPNCIITVECTFYRTAASGACRPCSPTLTIVLPPGPTMVPVTPPACDCGVRVEIIDVNGTAVTPPIVAGFNIPPIQPHGQGPDPSGCFPSGQIMFDVHPHGTDIHP